MTYRYSKFNLDKSVSLLEMRAIFRQLDAFSSPFGERHLHVLFPSDTSSSFDLVWIISDDRIFFDLLPLRYYSQITFLNRYPIITNGTPSFVMTKTFKDINIFSC